MAPAAGLVIPIIQNRCWVIGKAVAEHTFFFFYLFDRFRSFFYFFLLFFGTEFGHHNILMIGGEVNGCVSHNTKPQIQLNADSFDGKKRGAHQHFTLHTHHAHQFFPFLELYRKNRRTVLMVLLLLRARSLHSEKSATTKKLSKNCRAKTQVLKLNNFALQTRSFSYGFGECVIRLVNLFGRNCGSDGGAICVETTGLSRSRILIRCWVIWTMGQYCLPFYISHKKKICPMKPVLLKGLINVRRTCELELI